MFLEKWETFLLLQIILFNFPQGGENGELSLGGGGGGGAFSINYDIISERAKRASSVTVHAPLKFKI